MTTKQKLLFLGIILLAGFFRFYLIGQMPGGLFPDEAANGLDINLMQQGQLQPFYERGNGREALFFYLQWGSVELFGKTPLAHHLVSATVGFLAVIFTYFLTRRLALIVDPENKNRAVWIGLLASFLMAASSWHVVLSRTAFRANLIPLFTTLTFLCLVVAAQSSTRLKRYLFSIFTGAIFALGFYSYIAYRVMVPLVAILVLWPILVDLFAKPRFEQIKKFILPAIVAGIAFIIFIAPIAHYFYTHPGSFVGRSGQVSVFNPELNQGDLIGTIGQVSWLSFQAYFIHGDLNWRHNISGEAFLSIIISPFFLIGLIIAVLKATRYTFLPHRYKNDWTYFLLAGWFVSMLIPVVTTAEGIPHGLRSIGTIPVVFILAAFGINYVMQLATKIADKYWPFLKAWQQQFVLALKYLTIACFVIALASQTYILYFVYAANSPENFYSFRSDLTVVSKYLNEFGSKSNTYLILDKFSIQTVDYMTSPDRHHPFPDQYQPYKQVDPENSWELSGLKSGDRIVFTQSSIFDIKKFKQYHPQSYLEREDRNKFNQTVMAVYRIK